MKKLVMDLPEINDYRMVEGLNQLKTNLAFCGKDIKVITMTSSVPNEGKSSISLSLSRTLAESGKKILMVDADLRKSVMAARYHIQVDRKSTRLNSSHPSSSRMPSSA